MARVRIVCVLAFLAGCTDPMEPGMNHASSSAMMDASSSDAPVPPPAPLPDAVAPPGDGAVADGPMVDGSSLDGEGPCPGIQPTTSTSHNQGMECLSCHATISDPALRWTVAGTLWSDQYASSARAGATITVMDSAGLSVSMVTDVFGNFYTTKAVKLPLHPSATGCGTMSMMESATSGGCNSAGCHALTQPMYVQ